MSRIEPFGQKLTSPDDLGHHPDDLDIVRINLAEGPDADGSSRAASSPDRPEATPDDPDISRMIRMPGRMIRLQPSGFCENRGKVSRMIRDRIRMIRGTSRMIRMNVRTIRLQPPAFYDEMHITRMIRSRVRLIRF